MNEFPIQSGIIPFNHASYGVTTRQLLDRADAVRREVETDANTFLGPPLQRRLTEIAALTSNWIGFQSGELALTRNTTEAAAALAANLPLASGDQVVLLSCEYSSVIRGWEVSCARAGARLTQVPLPLPVSSAHSITDLLDATVSGAVTYLLVSQITSSAALALPTAALGRWVRDRGGVLLVDAAHGPGHVDVSSLADHSAVIFGTLHKWTPVPRAVGFLWAQDPHLSTLRPAEVSLTYDATTLSERFGWPGTYDPASRLVTPEALKLWQSWQSEGHHDAARLLLDSLTDALVSLGAVPTGARELWAPRLRAFLLPNVPLELLRNALAKRALRAWTGATERGGTILRVASHVYNDSSDVDALVSSVAPLLKEMT